MAAMQSDFFLANSVYKNRVSHGGAGSCGRKTARPLDSRRPILITMKSNVARGASSLLNALHLSKIKKIIQRQARKCGIKIHRLALLRNHLHVMVSFGKRVLFQNFLRATPGLIARLVTGASRKKPLGKFWSAICHTRVVRGGRRDYINTDRYVQANQLEAVYGRAAREAYLNDPGMFTERNFEMLQRAAVYSGLG